MNPDRTHTTIINSHPGAPAPVVNNTSTHNYTLGLNAPEYLHLADEIRWVLWTIRFTVACYGLILIGHFVLRLAGVLL